MGKVIANMSMSLDGFIADPNDQIDHLFGWMGSGEVVVPSAVEWLSFRLSPASAEYMRNAIGRVGALIAGRRLFDLTHGWGGKHPMGVPVVVVTHTAPTDWPHSGEFTFVDSLTDAMAVARSLAGDKDIVVASASIAQQCLRESLLDAIHVDQVPILLGRGVRWFDDLEAPIQLAGPRVIEGDLVTHLAYDVVRDERNDVGPGVDFEDIAAQPVLSVRRTIPVAQLQQMQGASLTAVWEALEAQGRRATGAPFVRYYSFDEDKTDVEVGFPVPPDATGTRGVLAGALPGGPVARYTHVGAHSELAEAYQRLKAGIVESGRTAGSPLWECYEWIDPKTRPDPSTWPLPARWRTELIQPLA